MRPAKAQMSLHIHAVSPEPSLFTHMKYGSRRWVWPKIRHLAPLDGCECMFEECLQKTKSTRISCLFCLFQVNFWVQREILNTQTEKTRADILAHFVKIGKVSVVVLGIQHTCTALWYKLAFIVMRSSVGLLCGGLRVWSSARAKGD